MTTRYGMERQTPKRKDYAEERAKSANAVQPRTVPDFKPWKVPQPYLDQLARCAAARSVGKSWRPV